MPKSLDLSNRIHSDKNHNLHDALNDMIYREIQTRTVDINAQIVTSRPSVVGCGRYSYARVSLECFNERIYWIKRKEVCTNDCSSSPS